MMKIYYGFFLVFFLSVDNCFSQDSVTNIFHLDKLPPEGVLLDKGWKFQSSDNPDYANPGYDDKTWQSIDPTKDVIDLPQIHKAGICWLRLHILLDNNLQNKKFVLHIFQNIASEIYINGQLVRHFGNVSNDPKQVKAYTVYDQTIDFATSASKEQVLAVRFSYQPKLPYTLSTNMPNTALLLFLTNEKYIDTFEGSKLLREISFNESFKSGLFFILTFLHLSFFVSYRLRRTNLFFAVTAFFFFLDALNSALIKAQFVHATSTIQYMGFVGLAFYSLAYFFLLIALYLAFNQRRKWFYPLISVWLAITLLIDYTDYHHGIDKAFFSTIILSLVAVGMTIAAVMKKKQGAKIIMIGMVYSFIAFLIFFLMPYSRIMGHVLFNTALLSIPLSISLYLAVEFATTSRGLAAQLKEVQRLSNLTLAQEQEKQQILASQNETLEKQVTQRTTELKRSLENLTSAQAQLIQREKMASLGELTAGIAHEIQNPLNFVNNFSEVNTELLFEMKDEMDKGNIDDAKAIANDVIDNEQKINHHGKRADAIIKGMLQHSRSSTGVKEATDINALADEYLRLSYQGLRAKDKTFNATLKTDFDESIGKINIIPQDIGRVILNLINNAFYAVNEKQKAESLKPKAENETYNPTVSIITKKIGDKSHSYRIEVKVKDNGNGIPQKIIDKIFQPFFTTKPTGLGTGLGLSLSYDIIKAHGGEIKVETREGELTEFKIILPLQT